MCRIGIVILVMISISLMSGCGRPGQLYLPKKTTEKSHVRN